MIPWKTDPVYQRIFSEIMTLWQSIDPSDRPLALRVEEHASTGWDEASPIKTIINTWMVDDAGPRLFQGLKRENYFPGGQQGSYSQFGLIRFHIASTENYVALSYHLGPDIESERIYFLEGEGLDLSIATMSAM